MKRISFFAAILFSFLSFGQFNDAAPWMNKSEDLNKRTNKPLQSISNDFELYWKGKDPNVKGSGFKPFKRWENHWQHFLKKDGSLATPDFFWKAWEQEQQLSKSPEAQWESVGPFTTVQKYGQGRVNTFIIDPNNPKVFYTGAPSGGLWKSTDSGINWNPISDQLPQIGVSGIAIDPNNSDIIYIATGDDDANDTYSVGVLKSTDGGLTWNKTGLDFSDRNEVSNEIYIHPEDSNILWVATSRGFFKSTDAGKNWDYKISIDIRDIKIKPGDPDVIYAVSSSKFYKSTDGGETFKVISSGLPETSSRFAIDVSPDNPEMVYLLSANIDNTFQGLYRSNNSGDTFQKTGETKDIFSGSTQAWYDMALTVNPDDANMVFVGVLDIWRSTNAGDSFLQMNRWFDPSEPSYTHADIHFLRYFNGNLFAGTDGGIYESSDDALSFTDLTENMNISQYYRIATGRRNAKKIVGGLQDNGGFAFSNNTWNQYHDGDGMDCVVDPNDEDVYYGFIQYGARLNVTYNSGVTPGVLVVEAPKAETDDSDSGGNWVTPLISNNKGDLFAGYSRVYKLNNNTWEPHSPRMFGGDLSYMTFASIDNSVMYVSRANRLFQSLDGGSTFTEVDYRFPTPISSIEVSNQNTNTVYVSTRGQFGQILRTTDAGITWEDISYNLPTDSKLVIKHQGQSPKNDLYLGTSIGVYHMNDDMKEWERFDEGLPNVPIYDLELNVEDAIITAGTYGRGVWQSPIVINKLDNDLSLLAVNSNNSVQCQGLTPVITVKNNGLESINSVTVNYSVDGEPYSFVYNGVITSDATREIELPNNPDIVLGNHDLQVEATTANDSYPANNVLFATFKTNNLGEGQYVNTFGDINDDTWLTETLGNPSELWEKGEASSDNFKSKFDLVYATNSNGNYSDETTAYLISPCYDLSRLENPMLRFDMIYDIEEDWDVLYVEYSTDVGTNWSILGTASDPNWYNSDFIDPERALTVGKQWTGTDLVPKEYSYELSALSSETSVLFRFVMASDQSVNGEGAAIDNFSIDATAVLAVEGFDQNNYRLYPNPSSSVFYINRKGIDEMQVSVYDVTGRLIYEDNNIIKSVYALDLSSVKGGLYFLKIREGSKQLATTLLKQ